MEHITLAQLEKFIKSKNVAEEFLDPINKTFDKFDITTINRKAMFLAQTSHESAGFKTLSENLNYSAKGLRSVFGKYFKTTALANEYARKPQKIASRVYANRMGNGNEASQEGWIYRGRGTIQLTGKDNYVRFAKDFDMGLEDVIEYLETTEGAMMSAGWFWDMRNLNRFADQGKFDTVTQRINGGQNGANHRRELYQLSKSIFI